MALGINANWDGLTATIGGVWDYSCCGFIHGSIKINPINWDLVCIRHTGRSGWIRNLFKSSFRGSFRHRWWWWKW